jgi:hypothetical protein
MLSAIEEDYRTDFFLTISPHGSDAGRPSQSPEPTRAAADAADVD